MDTRLYTLKDLAVVFDVHYGTLSALIKNEKWKIESLNGRRYTITDIDVVRLLHDIPRYQWLAQENSENDLANYFLSLFRKEYPNLTPAYSKNEVSKLLGMSVRWYEDRQAKGDFSGQYIRGDEILHFVSSHREYIRMLRLPRQRGSGLNMLRYYILTNLQKDGIKV